MRLFSNLEFNSFIDLFIEQIGDLYDAETRLTKALPKMAEAAGSSQLKQAFEDHLRETEGHVSRLEQIFGELQVKPKREASAAMKGLIAEGEDMIKAKGNPDIKDAALIAAAQRVEHYEIAAYGTARAFARRLGLTQAVSLLNETLQEESAADEKLSQIAEGSVNIQASIHAV